MYEGREKFKIKWHPIWECRSEVCEEFKTDLDKLIEGEVIRLSEPKELQNLWNGKQRVIIEQNKRANYYQSELQKLRAEVKDNTDIVHGDMIEFSHGPTPSVEAPTIFKLLNK